MTKLYKGLLCFGFFFTITFLHCGSPPILVDGIQQESEPSRDTGTYSDKQSPLDSQEQSLESKGCHAGETSPCTVDGIGVCRSGIRQCIRETLSWGDCIAIGQALSEKCDGLDNDCDGEIDEDWDGTQPCQVGVGECRRKGTLHCEPKDQGIVCLGTPGTPTIEKCDGLDNDCDGEIDEDWNETPKSCQVGIGGCKKVGKINCLVGKGVVCNVSPSPPQVELCDGLDNDCDGEIDEDWNENQICVEGLGECQKSGFLRCNSIKKTVFCKAVSGIPRPELCDGLDNNCNGQVDEEWLKNQACSVGVGACENKGFFRCSGKEKKIFCDATPGSPQLEKCHDKLDNDCNGKIDEGCCLPNKLLKYQSYSINSTNSANLPLGECLIRPDLIEFAFHRRKRRQDLSSFFQVEIRNISSGKVTHTGREIIDFSAAWFMKSLFAYHPNNQSYVMFAKQAQPSFTPKLHLIDRSNSKIQKTLSVTLIHKVLLKSVAITPDQKKLFAFFDNFETNSGPSHSLVVWNLLSGKHLYTITSSLGNLSVVRFSPDSSLLLIDLGGSNAVQLLNTSNGKRLYTLQGHSATSASFHPTNKNMLVTTRKGECKFKVWNLKTQRVEKVVPWPSLSNCSNSDIAVAFSPNGIWLAAAINSPSGVRFYAWEAPQFRSYHVLSAKPNSASSTSGNPLFSIGWSTDSRQLAIARFNELILLRCP